VDDDVIGEIVSPRGHYPLAGGRGYPRRKVEKGKMKKKNQLEWAGAAALYAPK